MICLKCDGLTVHEAVSDLFQLFALYCCLLCGAWLDSTMYRNRVVCRDARVEMPKF